jgi:tellurite resistance protein
MPTVAEPGSRLRHFPITLVPTVMGLAGLAIVFFKAQHALGVSWPLAQVTLGLVSAWFVVLLVVYGLKAVRHPREVAAEFRHPIRVNFFPGISISLLLLAVAYTELGWSGLARVLWWIGAPLHLALLLVILYGWFHNAYQVQSFNPAWFIPVVGPILVPVVGTRYAHPESSWFFFARGVVYWIVLLAVLLNRVFFHEPLPRKLLPTLFIMMAPPAVGFIAYVKLTGGLDPFARILFHFGLFNGLLLLTMVDVFRRVPYYVSWWGYTFPLDALTLSLFLMHQQSGLPFFRVAALVMTAVTAVTIAVVLARTLATAARGGICVPED